MDYKFNKFIYFLICVCMVLIGVLCLIAIYVDPAHGGTQNTDLIICADMLEDVYVDCAANAFNGNNFTIENYMCQYFAYLEFKKCL